MGQEQEPRWRARGGGPASVIEGGDDGLAGAGGGDDQVAVTAVDHPRGDQAVEDLLLEGVRAQLQQRGAARGVGGPLGAEGGGQAGAAVVAGRVVGLELGVEPQSLEGAGELLDDVGQVGGADLDHPLVAIAQRGRGEVGGPDIGGGQAAVAFEQPGLGVEARPAGVVGHLDLGARQAGQDVERGRLGGASERGGEEAQAQAVAAEGEGLERLAQPADAAHGDEGHHGIDAVGGGDLASQLVADGRLGVIASEECGDGERRGRSLGRRSPVNCQQVAGRRFQRLPPHRFRVEPLPFRHRARAIRAARRRPSLRAPCAPRP